jgi:hypothetical protein
MGNLTSKPQVTPDMVYSIADNRYIKKSEVADLFRAQLENYITKADMEFRLSTKLDTSAASEFATKTEIAGLSQTYATLASLEETKTDMLNQLYAKSQAESDVSEFVRSLAA